MLESAHQTRKIYLIYYLINHQWLGMAYIIFFNLQNTNSQILPTKTSPGNLITDYWKKKKKRKKERKKFKTFFQAFTGNFMLISLNWIIYTTSINHAQNQLGITWNLKLTIFKKKLAFHLQNREKKIIKQKHSAFIVAYFKIYIACCI